MCVRLATTTIGSVMRLTDEDLKLLRSIPADEPRIINRGEPLIATQELANALVKRLRYLGKHGLAEVAIFFDQGWCSSIDDLVGRHGADGLDPEHWVFNNGLCVQLTPSGESVVRGDDRDTESRSFSSLPALLDHITRVAPEVPELSPVETDLLDAYLRHLPRREVRYSQIQAENRAGISTYQDKLHADRKIRAHLRTTLDFNRTQRSREVQAVHDAVTGSSDLPSRPDVTPVVSEPDAEGYVAMPADPTAYVPASIVLKEHAPADVTTHKELIALLRDFASTRVKWTRPPGRSGEPRKNRLSIHIADWIGYVSRRSGAPEHWPESSESERAATAASIRKAGK